MREGGDGNGGSGKDIGVRARLGRLKGSKLELARAGSV